MNPLTIILATPTEQVERTPQEPLSRVLVVEDNPDAAEALSLLLTVLGHEVRVTHNGTDGVREAVAWCPDAIVSDIGLPGLDGYEVARELRRLPATANVRLIAVTGYGSEEDRRRALASGFDHHLTKPADPCVLLKLLGHPGSSSSHGQANPAPDPLG